VYVDVKGAQAPLLARTSRYDIASDDELPLTLPAEEMHLFGVGGVSQPQWPAKCGGIGATARIMAPLTNYAAMPP